MRKPFIKQYSEQGSSIFTTKSKIYTQKNPTTSYSQFSYNPAITQQAYLQPAYTNNYAMPYTPSFYNPYMQPVIMVYNNSNYVPPPPPTFQSAPPLAIEYEKNWTSNIADKLSAVAEKANAQLNSKLEANLDNQKDKPDKIKGSLEEKRKENSKETLEEKIKERSRHNSDEKKKEKSKEPSEEKKKERSRHDSIERRKEKSYKSVSFF